MATSELVNLDVVLELSQILYQLVIASVYLTLQTEKIQYEADCIQVAVFNAPINVALALVAVPAAFSFSKSAEQCESVTQMFPKELVLFLLCKIGH